MNWNAAKWHFLGASLKVKWSRDDVLTRGYMRDLTVELDRLAVIEWDE
jgi:hypothetical protein